VSDVLREEPATLNECKVCGVSFNTMPDEGQDECLSCVNIQDDVGTIAYLSGVADGRQGNEKIIEKLEVALYSLQDLALWMTGCGYEFTKHAYYLENEHLFITCTEVMLQEDKAEELE